jgi:hypothetical protein
MVRLASYLVLTIVCSMLLCGCGGDSAPAPVVTADDIPVAHTPPGGFHETFPEPVRASCTEPLVEGALERAQYFVVQARQSAATDKRACWTIR